MSTEAVRLVLGSIILNRISLPPVQPVKHFVDEAPGELWQVDIMGKVRFLEVLRLNLAVMVKSSLS